MPKGRTTEYAIWRACERFQLKPPCDCDSEFHKYTADQQALLIAYSQIREVEDIQLGAF